MISEFLLEKVLDKSIKSAHKYLKEKGFSLDSKAQDLEEAVSNHINQLSNWSSEIILKDVIKAKLTSHVFIELEIFLMPRRNKLDVNEKISTIASKNIFRHTRRHFVILGQPGAGKTTLMKFICQSVFLDENYFPEQIKVPILIRLRDLNIELGDRNVKGPIISQLFDIFGLVLRYKSTEVKEEELVLAKERILIPILEELKCLIIVDGFDEIAERKNKEKIAEDFKKLSLSLNVSRILLTSRTSDFSYSFENVDVLEICPLNEKQIEEFAGKWLDDEKKKRQFLQELNSSPFVDTAIRPLNMAHLCAIFERSGKLPEKPKTVYRKIVNLLLEEWDQQRGVKRLSQYGSFEIDRKFEFLCRLSYELTCNFKTTTFTAGELRQIYNHICFDFDLKKSEVNRVTEEIESHTGLLLEAGYERYEFAHKSIQEYLCAEHLVKLPSIPDLKRFASLPNEFAIAVTISSDSSSYLCEIVLNHLVLLEPDSPFITNFVNRLVLEKPDFNSSKELTFALIVLYTVFRKNEDGQLRLFPYDLPTQFENFVNLIFERNPKFPIRRYYDIHSQDFTEGDDTIFRMERRQNLSRIGRYKLPRYVYVKRSFVTDIEKDVSHAPPER